MANTLYDSLFAPHAGSDTVFLILEDGSEITHSGFMEMAGRFAHAIRAAGIGTGDRVAVQARKSPGALALYAAPVIASSSAMA